MLALRSFDTSIRILFLALAASVMVGCGGGGGGGSSPAPASATTPPPANPPPADPPPSEGEGGDVVEALDLAKLTFCHDDGTGIDVLTDDAGTELGYLCVIKPSDVEAGQLDEDPDSSGNGFGYHVVALPKTITMQTRAAILISGSYGSPYNPTQSVHLDIPAGTIRYSQTLLDGINNNVIVLQPAYNNPSSVNVDECGPDADFVQARNPNCHDLVRTWVLTGEQSCIANPQSCEPIDSLTLGSAQADLSNSFFNRLTTLVAYLEEHVDALPAALTALDYPQLHMLGHSQGAGHTYLIARYLQELARACFLAGPRDYDRIEAEYADWFVPIDDATLTPMSRMRGLVSNRDADRAITLAWGHLGLTDPTHFEVVSDPPGTQGHQAVFDSPDHTQTRQEFCF